MVTIYLPHFAREQLETCDQASVWARPIEFSRKPSDHFCIRLTFDDDDERFYDPIENEMFYPDRTEPETVLELLEDVDLQLLARKDKKNALKARMSAVGSHRSAIYRCFRGSSDAECWASYEAGKIKVISQHVFNFVGFGTVPQFTLQQERCLDEVLTEGAGLCLNRKDVVLCDGTYERFRPKDPRFAFDAQDIASLDGRTYKLFQDHDSGARGTAILTVRTPKSVKVLMEDHCSNVYDWMLDGDLAFLKELGFSVDFKTLDRHNHDFYRETYTPTPEDFESAVHINGKGKARKA